MTGKTNGSGHGHEPQNEPRGEDKIVHFPSLAERKKKMEWRKQAPAGPGAASSPFFNFGRIPPFTKTVVGLFIFIQIGMALLTVVPGDLKTQIVYTFGFMPAYFTGALKPFPYGALLSPVTHIFIHGGWMHLAFNSVMALSLGMFFERQFGTRTTAIFFFACGLAGALAYFVLNPFSEAPMVGASGSISGLFGAAIVLMGRSGSLRSRASTPWPIIIFWVAFMAIAGLLSGDSLAWQAHVGGFLAGIGLLYLAQTGRLRF